MSEEQRMSENNLKPDLWDLINQFFQRLINLNKIIVLYIFKSLADIFIIKILSFLYFGLNKVKKTFLSELRKIYLKVYGFYSIIKYYLYYYLLN